MPLRAALAALLLTSSCTSAAATAPDDPRCAAIHGAARSLFGRIGADGRFVYRLDAEGHAHGGYNVLRHAGTLWALADYHEMYPDTEQAVRLSRASAWLAACCLHAVEGWPAAAVWSAPEGKPTTAKLGAAGLSLAAWERLAAAGLQVPDAAQRVGLARFIVYLQRADGSFHARFRDSRRDGSWVSLYYPGEAALGLFARHRADSDETWRKATESALGYLAAERARTQRYPADHWALIAARELTSSGSAPGPALLRHAQGVADAILAEQTPAGDFGHERRTSPTATRLEGLAAAGDLLAASNPAFGARVRAAHARGAAFLRGIQLTTGPYPGALPRAAPDSPDARRGELRIDDTQHALSVLLDDARLQKYTCMRP